jgi:hypothetical protein
VPFRLTYQIPTRIELVFNSATRVGDNCHSVTRSMVPKSTPRDG